MNAILKSIKTIGCKRHCCLTRTQCQAIISTDLNLLNPNEPKWPKRRLFSSAPDTAAPPPTTTSTTAAKSKLAAAKFLSQPHRPALFPWRHVPGVSNLIPRVVAGTKEFQTLYPVPASDNVLANFFMQVPAWKAYLTPQDWKHELEQGTLFAFEQAVAGIVSNVYRVPLADIVDSNDNQNDQKKDKDGAYSVSFEYTPPMKKAKEETSDDNNTENSNSNNNKDYCPQIEDMMTRPLRNLFESAHRNGAHKLKIQLQVTPKQCYFYRLYGIPFVRKQQLEDDNGDGNNVLNQLFVNDQGRFQADFHNVYEFMSTAGAEQLMKYGSLETTLAAEALVVCDERFCVWDVETGHILQGHDDERPQEVAHVVTLERTATTEPSNALPFFHSVTDLTNWQVADIDDLVSTKKWFHVVLDPPKEKDNGDEKDNK